MLGMIDDLVEPRPEAVDRSCHLEHLDEIPARWCGCLDLRDSRSNAIAMPTSSPPTIAIPSTILAFGELALKGGDAAVTRFASNTGEDCCCVATVLRST